MKPIMLALALVGAAALPARAASFTLDSTNCTSSSGCYGLAWTLIVNSGSFDGGAYSYEALLRVSDDPLVNGTPSVLISAVDFKVDNSVSDALLFEVPASTSLSGWTTVLNNLSSAGCGTGPKDNGFVCSSASVLPSDPANFVASNTAQEWGWYFNGSTLFPDLIGGHVGAKLTDLSNPGQLLSGSYTAAVPEPGTLTLLGTGLVAIVASRRRRRNASRRSAHATEV